MARSANCRRQHRSTRRLVSESLERRQLLAAISWDGGGGNLLWTNADNWSTNTLPTATDDVTINVPAAITVTLSSGAQSVRSLVCAEGLTVSGGSLNIAEASSISGAFTLSGASTVLTGAGSLSLNGPASWTSGTMSGAGTTFVRNGATLTLGNSTVKVARPLTIDAGGTLDCPSGPSIELNNAIITNSGTLRHTGTAVSSYFAAVGSTTHSVVNLGTLTYSATAVCTWTSVPLTQSGTMVVSAGHVRSLQSLTQNATIQVDGAGIIEFRGAYTRDPAAKIVGTGSVYLGTGTHVIDDSWYQITGTTNLNAVADVTVNKVLNLNPIISGAPATFNVPVSLNDAGIYGTAVFNQPVTFTGTTTLVGNVTFNSTTTTNFTTLQIGNSTPNSGTTRFSSAAPISVSSLKLFNGTLDTPAPITVSTALDFTGACGMIGGGGGVTVAAGVTVNPINANIDVRLGKNLHNLGTWNLNTSIDFSFAGATLTNDGTINFTGAALGFTFITGSTNLVVNNGTITKAGTGTSAFYIPLTNNNAVAVNGGTLTMNAGPSLLTNNASITVAAGATLRAGSTVLAGGMISGGGTLTFAIGTSTIPPNRIASTILLGFSGGNVTVDIPYTFPSAITINGQITFNEPVTFNNNLTYQNGLLTFNDVPTFNGNVTAFSEIAFNTPLVVFSNLSIGSSQVMGNSTLRVTGTLTSLSTSTSFDPGITVHLPSTATFAFATSSITVRGLFDNDGTINVSGTSSSFIVSGDGILRNDGIINFTTASASNTVRFEASTLGAHRIINNGLIRKTGAATLQVTPRARIENNGTIDLDAGTLTYQGNFADGTTSTLAGTWDLASTATFATPVPTNAGTLILRPGAANLAGLSALSNNTGTLDLRGGQDFALTATTFSNRGTISLSADSVLTVNGNYQQAGTGTPTIASEVIGPADTQFGRVVVTGSNNLSNVDGGASRLQINLGGGYDPAVGTRFNVMTAASVTGAFTQTLGGPTPSGRGFTSGKTATQAFAEVSATAPAPVVLNFGFDYLTREALTFVFSQDVGASLARSDFTIINTTTGQTLPNTTGTLAYNAASNTATITLTGLLSNGNYTATLPPSSFTNASGTPGSGSASVVNFHVLAGDTNHDKRVDFDDLLALAQNYGATSGRTYATGDLDYDGGVDFDDLLKLAQNYGVALALDTASSTTSTRQMAYSTRRTVPPDVLL